jgi:SAM-dependent methyltransferase
MRSWLRCRSLGSELPSMTTDPVPTDDRASLRLRFTEDAERYDRARPGYPVTVFDDLAEAGAAGPGRAILEIGCGTGQATLPLAQRGCRIIALDIGAEMTRLARQKLRVFPSVEVITADFDSWSLPDDPFDVVLSATAFHWLDPATRVPKAASALRPGGMLAVISTSHVSGGTEGFFVDAQGCYERFDPATPPGLRLPAARDVPSKTEEVGASGLFDAPLVRRYEWDGVYSTHEYVDLLLTYSGHRALDHDARRDLLDCISRLIESKYGAAVVKRYMTELLLARRR